MTQNDHLLHAVRGCDADAVLARQVVGRLLDIHIRRFGLLGVHHVQSVLLFDRADAALDLVRIEHDDQMALAHTLVVTQDVDERGARGVHVARGDLAQLVPREDDIVAVHEQVIVLTNARDVKLFERRGLLAALLKGLEAAVLDGAVGAFEEGAKLAVVLETGGTRLAARHIDRLLPPA